MKVTFACYAVYCIQHTLEREMMGWGGTWITSWIWTRFEPTGPEAYGNHAIMNCCLLCSLQGVLLNILHWVCLHRDVKHTRKRAHTFPFPNLLTLWAANDHLNKTCWLTQIEICRSEHKTCKMKGAVFGLYCLWNWNSYALMYLYQMNVDCIMKCRIITPSALRLVLYCQKTLVVKSCLLPL